MQGSITIDKSLARAMFTIAIGAAFGVWSLRYSVGTLTDAGPGLFPLIVSVVLCLLGFISLSQARQAKREAIDFKLRGLLVISASFGGLAFLSNAVNMTVGIVFLVAVAGLASPKFSPLRSAGIAAVLIAIAFLMRQAFGLDLPLL